MRDPKSAACWKKSIEAKARRTFQYLYIPLALITGSLVVLARAIVAFLPDGGVILGITLTKTDASTISLIIELLGVGSLPATVLAVLKRIEPAFRRYNEAAIEVINETVEELHLNADVKQKMLDITTAELSPCTDPSLKDRCKKGLLEASNKLANLISGLPSHR